MKKVLLLMVLSISVMFGMMTSESVKAWEFVGQAQYFYDIVDEQLVVTNSYGTTENGMYAAIAYSISGCTTHSNTYVTLRQRSVAGAVGGTWNLPFAMNNIYYGYHSTIYGDEDIYLEVKIHNTEGYCDVIIIFDSDFNL